MKVTMIQGSQTGNHKARETLGWSGSTFHFTSEEAEAQRGEVTLLRSVSKSLTEQG